MQSRRDRTNKNSLLWIRSRTERQVDAGDVRRVHAETSAAIKGEAILSDGLADIFSVPPARRDLAIAKTRGVKGLVIHSAHAAVLVTTAARGLLVLLRSFCDQALSREQQARDRRSIL